MPREIKYSRGEDPLIFYSSPDVSRVLWKTHFLWIHHLPILPGPSELTKYFKGSGTWRMRNYYLNIKSSKQILLHVASILVPKDVTAPSWAATRGGQRSQNTNIGIPTCTHTCRAGTWSLFEMFCHCYSAMCMICTSVFSLSASGLILYVIHYSCWEKIYNQTMCKFKHFIATVKKNVAQGIMIEICLILCITQMNSELVNNKMKNMENTHRYMEEMWPWPRLNWV